MIEAVRLPIPKESVNAGKHPDRLTAEAFRDEVWRRAAGRSRLTGNRLFRRRDVPTISRGEVCHLKCRRVRPEWITDPNHAILLSAEEHRLSDHRGGRLLWILDPETKDPATDATKPILFVMRTVDGRILWERLR